MLDDELIKKLRKKQANLIEKSNKSVSLSQMINDYLEENMSN